MKPRRVPTSNFTYSLPGGNEDNDLWVERGNIDGMGFPVIVSVWEPTSVEREAIAGGGTVELTVWGTGHPPVALTVGPSLGRRRGGCSVVDPKQDR